MISGEEELTDSLEVPVTPTAEDKETVSSVSNIEQPHTRAKRAALRSVPTQAEVDETAKPYLTATDTLSRKLLDNTRKEKLKKQIVWADFSKMTNLKEVGDKKTKTLQVGSTLVTEVVPGYSVELKVKELKPFNATEFFHERVKGTADEGLYDQNATSMEIALATQDQNGSNLAKSGFSTETKLTNLTSRENGGHVGAIFEVKATYNGKEVPAHVVMADGEEAKEKEFVVFMTNGTPWQLLANVGQNGKGTPVPINENGLDKTIKGFGGRHLDGTKYYANPDQMNGGLGTQVFGSVSTRQDHYGVPIVYTKNATEVGTFISSSGNQSAMLGFVVIDEGDAPSPYKDATHLIKADKTTKQPYVGIVPADFDYIETTNPDGRAPWYGDDYQGAHDEGAMQLMDEAEKEARQHKTYPAYSELEDNYSIKIKVTRNGHSTSYLKMWIDHNNNGCTFVNDVRQKNTKI